MNSNLFWQIHPLFALLLLLPQLISAQDRRRDSERIHDPSTVYTEKGEYYFFSTGRGISLVQEQDDGRWTRTAQVFERDKLPAWHKEKVPENNGHLWAPDVIKIKDTYYLYYSVSSFGKQTSAIGLATGKTLDHESPEWGWKDQGPVITSKRGTPFNAIDPALFQDDDGSLRMSWGSFWNGLYLAQLDPKTGKLLDPKSKPIRLAWSSQIEAPFIHKRGDYYYLFINHGLCCRGVNSTYDIRVGRSNQITGPCLDKDKVDLKDDGGTLLLKTDGDRIGPGHASILKRNGQEFLAYHYYSKPDRGSSRFALAPLAWKDDWPVIDASAENTPSRKTNQASE
jgi:arabinan endo-1,5-alpha-L-arabinosidase